MNSDPQSPAASPLLRMVRLCGGAPLMIGALLHTSCDQAEQAAEQPVGPEVAVNDPVALKVGGRTVRLSELQAEIDFLRERKNPLAADREQFLQRMVDRLVAVEEAKSQGIDEDPELLRQWENLLIGRLERNVIEEKAATVDVSDEEVRAYYNANLETYVSPPKLHLALLFLPVPARADEEALEKVRLRMKEARDLAGDLPEGTRGFGALAMNYSEESTSRFKGGDVGWLIGGDSRSRWPEEVLEAGFALSDKGDLSEVISTEEGVYLLMKLDSRPEVIRPLEGRLRSALKAEVLRDKRAALRARFKEDWRSSQPVTLEEDVLSNLDFNPAAASPGSIPAAP